MLRRETLIPSEQPCRDIQPKWYGPEQLFPLVVVGGMVLTALLALIGALL
jgi:hypothetical protein